MPMLTPASVTEAPSDAQEIFSGEVMATITRALPPIERAYAHVRFTILRPKLLSVMDLLLEDEGRILDIGCGFGLFAAYFGSMQRRRRVVGVDPDGRRIRMARKVAATLGLTEHTFVEGDIRSAPIEGTFDGAYVLDVMHHIPYDEQRAVLTRLRDLLKVGGTLIVKDITTEPRSGLWFTRVLDRAMVGFSAPLAYRNHRDWCRLLSELGFKVRAVRVPDILPYPHVVITARKL